MINRCPITYEICQPGQRYSEKGLKSLSRKLSSLNDFPYSSKEQIQLATLLATKLSIQGVQPKLSVILDLTNEQFEVTEKGGKFILKSPQLIYEEVPQNEDLTMKLAKLVKIEVPFHGMIYNSDGSLSYIIKRFDRSGNRKFATEDFSQLLHYSRDTKYESSMEKIVLGIDKYCTFPILEKVKLFRLIIFNFLTGNEDMHLKNFTIIRRKEKVELSPAYDLLNTTIIINSKDEIALPIRGKKSNLKKADLITYFGVERLELSNQMIENELLNFTQAFSDWQVWINKSFLSEKMKHSYTELIQERRLRLGI